MTQYAQTIVVGATGNASLVRQLGKPAAFHATGTPSIQAAATRNFTVQVAASAAPSLAYGRAYFQTIAAVATASASVLTAMYQRHAVTIAAAATAAVTRTIGVERTISIGALGIPDVQLFVNTIGAVPRVPKIFGRDLAQQTQLQSQVTYRNVTFQTIYFEPPLRGLAAYSSIAPGQNIAIDQTLVEQRADLLALIVSRQLVPMTIYGSPTTDVVSSGFIGSGSGITSGTLPNEALVTPALTEITVGGGLSVSGPGTSPSINLNSGLLSQSTGNFAGVDIDPSGHWVLVDGNRPFYGSRLSYQQPPAGVNSVSLFKVSASRTSPHGSFGISTFTDAASASTTYLNGYFTAFEDDGQVNIYKFVDGQPMVITAPDSQLARCPVDTNYHTYQVAIEQPVSGTLQFTVLLDGMPYASASDTSGIFPNGRIGFTSIFGADPVIIDASSYSWVSGPQAHQLTSLQTQHIIGSDYALNVSPSGGVTGTLPASGHDPAVLQGSVTGTGKNLTPDSDLKWYQEYWDVTFAGSLSFENGQGSSGGNAIVYTAPPGEAVLSGYLYMQSSTIALAASAQYTLSGFIDGSFVVPATGSAPAWIVTTPDFSTTLAVASQQAFNAGRVSATFMVPATGVTNAVVLCHTGNCEVTPGQALVFSEPQLESGNVMTAYVPNIVDDLTGYWAHGVHSPYVRQAIFENPNSPGNASLDVSLATKQLPYLSSAFQVANAINGTLGSDGSYLANQAVSSRHIQMLSVNSVQISPVRYDTTVANTYNGSAGNYDWILTTTNLPATAVVPNNSMLAYQASTFDPGSAIPATNTMTLSAGSSATASFQHVNFNTGSNGNIGVYFTGQSVGQGAAVQDSGNISGLSAPAITSASTTSTSNQQFSSTVTNAGTATITSSSQPVTSNQQFTAGFSPSSTASITSSTSTSTSTQQFNQGVSNSSTTSITSSTSLVEQENSASISANGYISGSESYHSGTKIDGPYWSPNMHEDDNVTSFYTPANTIGPSGSYAVSLTLTSVDSIYLPNTGYGSGIQVDCYDPNGAHVFSKFTTTAGTFSVTSGIGGVYTWKVYATWNIGLTPSAGTQVQICAGSISWPYDATVTTYYDNNAAPTSYALPANTLAPTGAGTQLSFALNGVSTPSDSYGSSHYVVSLKDPNGNVVANWTCTSPQTLSYSNSAAIAGAYTWITQAFVSSNSNGTSTYNTSFQGSLYWFEQVSTSVTTYSNVNGSTNTTQTASGTLAPTSAATQISLAVSGVAVSNNANGNSYFAVYLTDPNGAQVASWNGITGPVTLNYSSAGAIAGVYTWHAHAYCTNTGTGTSSYVCSLSSTAEWYQQVTGSVTVYSNTPGTPSTYTTPSSTLAPTSAGTQLALQVTAITTPSNSDGASYYQVVLKNPSGTVVQTWTGIAAPTTISWSNSSAPAGSYSWVVNCYCTNTSSGTASYSDSITASQSWWQSVTQTTTAYSNVAGQALQYQTPSNTLAPSGSATQLGINLNAVNAPSSPSIGASYLDVSLKDPSNTTVLHYNGIIGPQTLTYYASGAASGVYTWVIFGYCTNLGAGTMSFTDTWSGTQTWYQTAPAGGSVHVLAADGVTQRLATSDNNVHFTYLDPSTVQFQIVNDAGSDLSFQLGVSVSGI